MRDQFATQAVREIVACIQIYIVSEYTAYRTIEIQLVPETFGLLLFGLVGMMKAKPDITDDELALLIAQTLRLDMTVMDPPPWPEHPALRAVRASDCLFACRAASFRKYLHHFMRK